QMQKNPIVNSEQIEQSTENGKITCYAFGKTKNDKQDVVLSTDDAAFIFHRLNELKTGMAGDPYSKKTESLKIAFVDLLEEKSLLINGVSKEAYLSLLNPRWAKRVQDTKKQPLFPQPFTNRGTSVLCSVGGQGRGLLIPLFLLPRPHIGMLWLGNGITIAANLLTSRGYVAQGVQTGFTLGFMGIGISYAIPGYTIYGFIGYALFATTTAEDVAYYPLNRPPQISDVQPPNGAQNVSLILPELQFRIQDADSDLMSYSVTTTPFIGEGSGILKPDGIYTIPLNGLDSSTKYTWIVEVSDNQDTTMQEFTFTTIMMAPFVSNPLPKNNAQYVPIWTPNLFFDLKDYQVDLMNWTVETSPDIGSGSSNGVGDGRYNISISGLKYYTNYTWFVNTTDGTFWTRRTYTFTTTPEGILVFEPSVDTFVGEHSPNVNHGGEGHMLVSDKYGHPSNYDARGMVLFDLSDIPSGSTIISAILSLYYYRYDDTNPIGREITCHRILESWDEMTVTYNTLPNSDAVECSSTILPGYFTWVNWNVTSEVDDFINSGDDNYGWMIRDYKAPWGGVNIPQQYYYTSNAVDLHPALVIEINLP
ncbi:MAG TPA: DNRLRE domain-containing protein, partial [Candidatus Thermoplasmatota archaeon]|nr:DNRLRE domain-containing protein [Candidatus Thermoplasmatota archaeon]